VGRRPGPSTPWRVAISTELSRLEEIVSGHFREELNLFTQPMTKSLYRLSFFLFPPLWSSFFTFLNVILASSLFLVVCLSLQHTTQTHMPSAGFEPAIPASDKPQAYALDRAATEIDDWVSYS
jgi:hypothetical protein